MIIKTKIGRSFGGCVGYLTGKKEAEIIRAEGVRMDSPKHMTEDFNRVRKINPELGKAVWHTSFSFAPEDRGKVTEDLIKNITNDYVNKFGLEQYAVVKHNDAGHEHFHLIANRVKSNGKSISDQYCASRGMELSKRLELKYELAQAQTIGKRLELTHQDKLHGLDKVKYEIYEAINNELPNSRSIEELGEKLKSHGISMEMKTQSTGRVYGVSFAKGKECFKGSEIDKNFGINNLTKLIENAIERAIEKNVPGLSLVKKVINLSKDRDHDQGLGF